MRSLPVRLAVLIVTATIGWTETAVAYTEKEISETFRRLDANRDGKVDSGEYDLNKVRVIYRHAPKSPGGDVTFEETRVSRRFFDSADVNKDGKLSPVEMLDALQFEAVDTAGRGYFDLGDLRRFMKSIGR